MQITEPQLADRQPLSLSLVRLLRPHHALKNLLVFVPLLLSHRAGEIDLLTSASIAFVAFCLCAFAGYIINDLRDREADRHHPLKRQRPLASGAVSPPAAVCLAAAMLVLAFGLSLALLPLGASFYLAVYVVATVLYSFWLKTRLLVDVFVLAGLYTLRLLAGGAAVQIELTPWLLAFSMFIFTSLAFAKRYAELAQAASDDAAHLKARNYRHEDMAVMQSVGSTSGYLAVLVLAIYINSDLAQEQYSHPRLLWLVCPILLYWITRVWFLARRGVLHEDPILFGLHDRVSWIAGILALGLILSAALLP